MEILDYNNDVIMMDGKSSYAMTCSSNDCTLMADGQCINAHKDILSSVSPYFEKLFNRNPHDFGVIYAIADVTFEELTDLVKYIYTGSVDIPNERAIRFSKLLAFLEIFIAVDESPDDPMDGSSLHTRGDKINLIDLSAIPLPDEDFDDSLEDLLSVGDRDELQLPSDIHSPMLCPILWDSPSPPPLAPEPKFQLKPSKFFGDRKLADVKRKLKL